MAEHLIPTSDLHRWVVDIWNAAGSNEVEARLAADHLVGANLAPASFTIVTVWLSCSSPAKSDLT